MSTRGAALAAKLRLAAAPLALALLAAGCAHAPQAGGGPPEMAHPEGAIFDPSIDAHAAVDTALAQAAASDRLVLIVMGANWCHDSRALTSYLMEPDLAALLETHYDVVYIDVGLPQTGDGFNLDIAERFGVTSQGTPNVLVLSSAGDLLNTQDNAVSWRNSASRSAQDVYAELLAMAGG